MDDSGRRTTIEALIELASGWDVTSCWDSTRAEDLLRAQSSADEVRRLGGSEALIDRLWPQNGR